MRTTKEVDARYAGDWSKWPVPQGPIAPKWEGPWNRDISDLPTDVVRTERLKDFDAAITMNAGKPPYQGSTWGLPLTLVDSAKAPRVPVWDLSKAIEYPPGKAAVLPITRIPDPDRLYREGDPVGGSDRHAYTWDPTTKVLTEMILADKCPPASEWFGLAAWAWRLRTGGNADWTVSYSGGGPGVAVWDTTKPWDPATKVRGIVAANVPQYTMVPTWDQLVAGETDVCMFFVLPNYNPGVTGFARASDGKLPLHPLRAGEMLILTDEAYARLSQIHRGTAGQYILDRAATGGLFVGDKKGPGSGEVTAHIPLSMDSRWAKGEGKIGPVGEIKWRLTDFRVVKTS